MQQHAVVLTFINSTMKVAVVEQIAIFLFLYIFKSLYLEMAYCHYAKLNV